MSSISSTTSSSSTKPFRSIYSKDARGHNLTDAYARKYGSSTVASSPIPIPTITRCVYAKDARGVQISTSYEADDYENSSLKTMPMLGDDGKMRNPYDHGQRERSLGYWSELRNGATSLRSSRSSMVSAK